MRLPAPKPPPYDPLAWQQLAIWLWAATSKLNHHFPSVIGVMTSNSPLLAFDRTVA